MSTTSVPSVDAQTITERLAGAGFTRQGRQNLWLREVSPGPIVHTIAIATSGPDGQSRLACGVWLGALARILKQESDPHLDLLARCHIRFDDCGPVTAGGLKACLPLLDQIRSLKEADAFIESGAPRSWPSGVVAELYLAGIAVLTGHPATLARVTAAARHLEGTGKLSEAANHLYAMVATAE